MKILITGSNGLLGSSLLKEKTKHILIPCTHKEFNLEKEKDVKKLFSIHKNIDCIIHCAALVGGIKINKEKPADLFYKNIMINSLMTHYAFLNKVKKMFVFSSACAFPEHIYPLQEEIIHDGKPYIGNYAYAYAKRMVDIQVKAYNEQHKTKYTTIIPLSLYGANDNFCLDNGHFIPSLIHKCYLAKKKKEPLVIWGDGSPERELIFSQDLSSILLKMLEKDLKYDKYLIGSGETLTIKYVAEKIAKIMNVKEIIFDTTKPNGQQKKPANCSRLLNEIKFKFTPFNTGIKKTINWFLKNYPNVRGTNA